MELYIWNHSNLIPIWWDDLMLIVANGSCDIMRINSPLWVLDLLCDKVEGVPSRVGEQSRIQSQSDGSWISRWAIK